MTTYLYSATSIRSKKEVLHRVSEIDYTPEGCAITLHGYRVEMELDVSGASGHTCAYEYSCVESIEEAERRLNRNYLNLERIATEVEFA